MSEYGLMIFIVEKISIVENKIVEWKEKTKHE